MDRWAVDKRTAMTPLIPYLLAALGAILFWGAKLIVQALRDLSSEMKEMRGELSAHRTASGERIKGLETQMAGIADTVNDIDDRLRHVERITDRLNIN